MLRSSIQSDWATILSARSVVSSLWKRHTRFEHFEPDSDADADIDIGEDDEFGLIRLIGSPLDKKSRLRWPDWFSKLLTPHLTQRLPTATVLKLRENGDDNDDGEELNWGRDREAAVVALAGEIAAISEDEGSKNTKFSADIFKIKNYYFFVLKKNLTCGEEIRNWHICPYLSNETRCERCWICSGLIWLIYLTIGSSLICTKIHITSVFRILPNSNLVFTVLKPISNDFSRFN